MPGARPPEGNALVCGAAGSGKTLFAMTFLVERRQPHFDEPGVFMSFEERAEDLAANVASLGYDIEGLVAARKLAIDHVRIERSEIEESGEYDLEGLFVRLGHAIDSVGAKRVVLDTIEALFAGFSEQRDPARRAAAPVRLAQGQGRHRHHHGRAWRGPAHALWHRGICLRLRHPARQPSAGAGHDQTPARREIPRLGARDERISVPHRRSGDQRHADHLGRTGARHLAGTGADGRARAGRDARHRRLLSRFEHSDLRARRNGQDPPSAAIFVDAACTSRRALPLLRIRGIARPNGAQHALGRHRPQTPPQRRSAAIRGGAAKPAWL